METTPVSLLERLRQPDDTEAWARFVELYTPLIYYWARRAGLQEHDAADLVQDVFIIVVQKMGEFIYDPSKGFRNWLRVVTLNKWRDHCKRRERSPTVEDVQAVARAVSPDDAEAFWEAEYSRHLVGRALRVMQAEFQPGTWRACWETVVNSRPAADVAAELGLSENAVYIAKSRVLRRLRQELEGLMD